MEQNEKLKKFVYEDNNETKVVKGYILAEDEFTYTIEAYWTKANIVIGKRSIIKISDAESGNHE